METSIDIPWSFCSPLPWPRQRIQWYRVLRFRYDPHGIDVSLKPHMSRRNDQHHDSRPTAGPFVWKHLVRDGISSWNPCRIDYGPKYGDQHPKRSWKGNFRNWNKSCFFLLWLTLISLLASKVASSICGKHGSNCQLRRVGDGGWNSGVPLVLPFSSYL